MRTRALQIWSGDVPVQRSGFSSDAGVYRKVIWVLDALCPFSRLAFLQAQNESLKDLLRESIIRGAPLKQQDEGESEDSICYIRMTPHDMITPCMGRLPMLHEIMPSEYWDELQFACPADA